MSTLLLRLAAPLQSWGLEDKFDERHTMREPTKSGVIGMLAAALGRRREEPIDDLFALRFGVRVDQPGQLLHDFHMVHAKCGSSWVTNRYYLADAVFVIGLEGDDNLIHKLEKAVQSPVYPLYLGRRSCPPTGKIVLDIFDETLENALHKLPWQASICYQEKNKSSNLKLSFVIDTNNNGIKRRDLPLSFNLNHRMYTFRFVTDEFKSILSARETEHNPMQELEG